MTEAALANSLSALPPLRPHSLVLLFGDAYEVPERLKACRLFSVDSHALRAGMLSTLPQQMELLLWICQSSSAAAGGKDALQALADALVLLSSALKPGGAVLMIERLASGLSTYSLLQTLERSGLTRVDCTWKDAEYHCVLGWKPESAAGKLPHAPAAVGSDAAPMSSNAPPPATTPVAFQSSAPSAAVPVSTADFLDAFAGAVAAEAGGEERKSSQGGKEELCAEGKRAVAAIFARFDSRRCGALSFEDCSRLCATRSSTGSGGGSSSGSDEADAEEGLWWTYQAAAEVENASAGTAEGISLEGLEELYGAGGAWGLRLLELDARLVGITLTLTGRQAW